MQVWQLFHILVDYCEITKDNARLYCNMVKFLLQNRKIDGENSIDSLTKISDDEWYSYFHGSLYSSYNVKKLQAMLRNVNDYICTHEIRSVINTPSTSRRTNDCVFIKSQDTKPLSSITTTYCGLGFAGFAGFCIGCAYVWYLYEI